MKGVMRSLGGRKHREITDRSEVFLVPACKKATCVLQQLTGNDVILLLEKHINLQHLDTFSRPN